MAQFSLGISAARPLRVGSCEVYVGTCSWADPNFVKEGQFYPRGAGTDPKKRLQFYSTVFPTVEVDATYHALQPAERAAHWVEWTPPQFIFTMKAFALFTGHDTDPRRLPKEIAPLIPESLRAVEAVGAGQLPADVVPDLIQRAYLPPADVEVTAPWSVVRFHGRNPAMVERRAPTNRVYDYSYTQDELRPWAQTVREVSPNLKRIFLLFNNHYRGQSARNARELALMLE